MLVCDFLNHHECGSNDLVLPMIPQAFVALAISLLLCRRDASCVDLVLVVACFSSQPHIVARMRHLPQLVVLLLITCLGAPLMMLLWVQYGTGNANFVFFLCLGASMAVVLAIVEFTRAAMRQRSIRSWWHALWPNRKCNEHFLISNTNTHAQELCALLTIAVHTVTYHLLYKQWK